MNPEQSRGVTRTFAAGDVLFRQGESSRELYVIRSGSVRVSKEEGGVEIELARVGPGEVVGEIAAIDAGVRSASVVALEETEVFCVDGEQLRATLGKVPEWFRKIAAILVQRLREVDKRIETTIGDKTAHVAALVAMMTWSGEAALEPDGGYALDRKMVENELVDILGLSLTAADETLERLAARKLITLKKSRVVVVDREKLRRFGAAALGEAREESLT